MSNGWNIVKAFLLVELHQAQCSSVTAGNNVSGFLDYSGCWAAGVGDWMGKEKPCTVWNV